MLRTVKNRRGMTLAEIMVCLGVVAIMITMVVSFALLLSDKTRASSENTSAHQDLTLIQSGVEAWVNGVAEHGAEYSYTPLIEAGEKSTDAAILIKDSSGKTVGSEFVQGWTGWTAGQMYEIRIEAENEFNVCNILVVDLNEDEEVVDIGFEVWLTNGLDGEDEKAATATGYSVSVGYDAVHGKIGEDGEMDKSDRLTSLVAEGVLSDTELSFSYGTLTGKLPDGRVVTMRTENVSSVAFSVMEKFSSAFEAVANEDTEDTGDAGEAENTETFETIRMVERVQEPEYLFFCTVKLKDGTEHTFTVNPRVGDSAAGSLTVEIETENPDESGTDDENGDPVVEE